MAFHRCDREAGGVAELSITCTLELPNTPQLVHTPTGDVCTNAYTHESRQSTSWVFVSASPPCLSRKGLSLTQELTNCLDWFLFMPLGSVSLELLKLGSQGVCLHVMPLCGCWEAELRSSCLHSERCAHLCSPRLYTLTVELIKLEIKLYIRYERITARENNSPQWKINWR